MRTVIAAVLAGLVWGQAALGGEPPMARARLGMNLAGPADWNTELPLVNVFAMSRPWISQREGAGWGKGPPLELDERGWVKRLEPGCFAESLVCTIEDGRYPAGVYTVFYEGDGELEFGQAASVVKAEPGRISLRVDPKRGAIAIRLKRVNPQNIIRDIRVILPGFEKSYEENPWNPTFLERWRGVACLRYMDFMHTNNSNQARWDDRPRLEDATFSEKGLPAELLIDLANRLECDPWFCMPHRADNAYVEAFAKLVNERLDPGLKAWVEYSNEVWNGMFAQNRHAGEQGQKLGFAEKPWEAAWKFTAHRSIEIFRIWEREFGGKERLVRVLPSQATEYVCEQIVSFGNAAAQADVLAIAPYMGFSVPLESENKVVASSVERWSVEQLLDHVERVVLPRSLEAMSACKSVADRHGLGLVAYEAGQHLVGVAGGENNEKLTALLQGANRHPRMGEIYAAYLRGWTERGGGCCAIFRV